MTTGSETHTLLSACLPGHLLQAALAFPPYLPVEHAVDLGRHLLLLVADDGADLGLPSQHTESAGRHTCTVSGRGWLSTPQCPRRCPPHLQQGGHGLVVREQQLGTPVGQQPDLPGKHTEHKSQRKKKNEGDEGVRWMAIPSRYRIIMRLEEAGPQLVVLAP